MSLQLILTLSSISLSVTGWCTFLGSPVTRDLVAADVEQVVAALDAGPAVSRAFVAVVAVVVAVVLLVVEQRVELALAVLEGPEIEGWHCIEISGGSET